MAVIPSKVARSPLARNMLLLLAAYVVLCILFALTAQNFVTRINIVNILRQASMVGIIGIGMTMVIVSAEIDLSVGAVAALCGVIVAYLAVNWEWPLYVAIPTAILIGMSAGAFIAAFRVLFNIPSFITSLALLTALRSASFLITGGFPIGPMPPGFTQLANGYFGPVPYLVVIMVILYALGWLAMTQTAWGRAIYAVGGNEEAARLSGISVGWTKLSVFMINSGLAALAGIMLVSRLNSGTPTVADGWELDVIAAVIIGGTSLFGGAGSVLGTLLGAVFMTTLRTGMVLLGVSPYAQGVVSGIVILVAVLSGALRIPRFWKLRARARNREQPEEAGSEASW
jgi:ribose/xylose/arabinose/galactoside ABC-type transport system permease subunit